MGAHRAARGKSTARGNIRLRDWSERKDPERRAQAIIDRANQAFSSIINARVFVSAPPAIRSLGNATGFDFELQDQAGLGHESPHRGAGSADGAGAAQPCCGTSELSGRTTARSWKLTSIRKRPGRSACPSTPSTRIFRRRGGGKYVNDFVDRSRVKVYVQADAPFRMKPEDFNRWYFRNDKGRDGAVHVHRRGPLDVRLCSRRYNGVSAVRIQGRAAAGMSSGTAMLEMERLMGELPEGIGYQWTGMSFQERLSGSQAPFLYALSILVVFLCLAALYESWSIPLSVILVVPLGVLGALVATSARGCPTMCISRSACWRPSGSRRRTPF